VSDLSTAAPWEANAYFDTPSVKVVPVAAGNTGPLCLASPQRVGLIISCNLNGANFAFIGPSSSVGNGTGIMLTPQAPLWQGTHHDWAVLVQSQWFGFATGAGSNFSVIELLLHDWPQSDPHDNMDVQDYLAYIADYIKSLAGRNGSVRANATVSAG
jgi:hypothetical protein